MNSMNRIVHEMKAANWGVIFSKLVVAVVVTFKFEYALFLYVIQKKQYSQVTIFDDDKWAKAQIYSIALIFRLWSKKHYRSPSFQQDMKDNLQNVAIPGTGIPLSIFCCNSVVCLAFIVIVNPIACLFSAVNKSRHNSEDFEQFAVQTLEYYVSHILHPDDWFSFWRLNCRLVSHHSSLKSTPGYLQEDKWTFLVSGRNSGVPVSPFMDIDSIVCKNKNIEGGMGIHFFKNAAHGGDWIIQEKLDNAAWLKKLLPPNSPLSTMRVITSSTWSLGVSQRAVTATPLASPTSSNEEAGSAPLATATSLSSLGVRTAANNLREAHAEVTEIATVDAAVAAVVTPSDDGPDGNGTEDDSLSWRTTASPNGSDCGDCGRDSSVLSHPGHGELSGDHSPCSSDVELRAQSRHYIQAISAVLRLGRAGAATDHSSVLFDVDIATGRIKEGTTNAHWYQLGVNKARKCPWLPPANFYIHPDAPHPQVTGEFVPGMQEALTIVTESHFKMMPDVPLVGWDVAFTDKGVFLLEVNLSCNFFRGSFDIPSYIKFVDAYWLDLEKEELRQNRF